MEKLEILGAAAKAGQNEIVYFLNFTNTDEERMLIAEFLRDVHYQEGISPYEIRSVALKSDDNLETSKCIALAFYRESRYHIISANQYDVKDYFRQIL